MYMTVMSGETVNYICTSKHADKNASEFQLVFHGDWFSRNADVTFLPEEGSNETVIFTTVHYPENLTPKVYSLSLYDANNKSLRTARVEVVNPPQPLQNVQVLFNFEERIPWEVTYSRPPNSRAQGMVVWRYGVRFQNVSEGYHCDKKSYSAATLREKCAFYAIVDYLIHIKYFTEVALCGRKAAYRDECESNRLNHVNGSVVPMNLTSAINDIIITIDEKYQYVKPDKPRELSARWENETCIFASWKDPTYFRIHEIETKAYEIKLTYDTNHITFQTQNFQLLSHNVVSAKWTGSKNVGSDVLLCGVQQQVFENNTYYLRLRVKDGRVTDAYYSDPVGIYLKSL